MDIFLAWRWESPFRQIAVIVECVVWVALGLVVVLALCGQVSWWWMVAPPLMETVCILILIVVWRRRSGRT